MEENQQSNEKSLFINQHKKVNMKSRNFLKVLPLVIMMSLVLPDMTFSASNNPTPPTEQVKIDNPRAQQLVQRLEEIKAMDKSTLTRSERKALRKEVKDIKKEMKGGIYLSVGAIIIIILLLILIL
jgi:hypothetical protein